MKFQTATRGETQCPHIDKSSLKEGKILIADNHASSIRLPVVNLDALLNQVWAYFVIHVFFCIERERLLGKFPRLCGQT